MFTTTETLLPNVIRRQKYRARPYATIVSTDGVVQHLTFADLENSSNRASWFLTKNIRDCKVFYMGPNDIRYLIWVIAAIKTGKCVLLPPLGGNLSANKRFFEAFDTKVLLYAPEAGDLLAPFRDATQQVIEHVASPTYGELMHDEVVPVYPFEKAFDDLRGTGFVGLYTSGTSGHPKPIYWDHSALSTVPSFLDSSIRDHDSNSSNLMRDLFQHNNLLVPFPLFHFGGIGPALGSIYCDNTLVLPAPGTRLSPENYTKILQHGRCTATLAPPSVLEAILGYSPGVDVLARLKLVAYTGGPLNPTRGEALAQKLPHFCTILASTEGGAGEFVSYGDSSHWNSFKFIDVGQRMEEIAPGIYELVFPKTELVSRMYAFFHTHPHLNLEFRTRDLFSPVEGQDGWWIYRGRADNWIAMSNGLKMDPTEMENTIASHPDITGVLVAGSHRFRLCLLIELKKDTADDSLETIWPIIETANKKVSKFGRVPKELVLFAKPDKPFVRAAKGTIQRRLTINIYEEDLDRLYNQVEEGLLTSGIPLPSSTEPQDLTPFLKEIYSQTLLDDNDSCDIDIDDDLVALGLDSLSAFILLARLKAGFRKYGVEAQKVQSIDNKMLYAATTLRQLAEKLSQVLSPVESSSRSTNHDMDNMMIQLLEKYDSELQKLSKGKIVQKGGRPDTEVVILTGSTGSLGSYILSSLITRREVRKVFCLNRSGGAKTQAASLKARGLPDLSVDGERVVFLQIKPTEPKLGLADEDYDMLTRETTSIIHNAFPVNFLLSLQSFEPQFQFLLNLLKLAVDSQHSSKVLFVSSITAAMSGTVDGDQKMIPEKVLGPTEAKDLLPQGYARAKYICERLLTIYTSTLGGRASVLRVGQVCGPFSGTGVWSVSEWVPSLVLSSKFLGAVPDSLGSLEVNWVPVDKLGDIVAEVVSTASEPEDSAGFLVYNVVNPTTTSWSALIPALQAASPLAVVSAAEWVDQLQKSDKGPHIIHKNPAAKLVEFYKQTMAGKKTEVTVETTNLMCVSETAADLLPINQGHMARWMQGWGL